MYLHPSLSDIKSFIYFSFQFWHFRKHMDCPSMSASSRSSTPSSHSFLTILRRIGTYTRTLPRLFSLPWNFTYSFFLNYEASCLFHFCVLMQFEICIVSKNDCRERTLSFPVLQLLFRKPKTAWYSQLIYICYRILVVMDLSWLRGHLFFFFYQRKYYFFKQSFY